MVDASEYIAPDKMSAKCNPPIKKTAGISTLHCPATGRSHGARKISTKTKRNPVKNTGGIQVTPIFAATAFSPHAMQTISARSRWDIRMEEIKLIAGMAVTRPMTLVYSCLQFDWQS